MFRSPRTPTSWRIRTTARQEFRAGWKPKLVSVAQDANELAHPYYRIHTTAVNNWERREVCMTC